MFQGGGGGRGILFTIRDYILRERKKLVLARITCQGRETVSNGGEQCNVNCRIWAVKKRKNAAYTPTEHNSRTHCQME
jgi:hypothetical protein